MPHFSRRTFIASAATAMVGALGTHRRQTHAATAPGYRYFDYSRADWGANPAYNGRRDLYYPQSSPPVRVTSPDLDTGKYYYPTIQPGQKIATADLPQNPTGLGIHYTATPTTYDFASTAQQLRGMQYFHAMQDWGHLSYGPGNPDPLKEVDNQGYPDGTFGDIGYHFLIDGAGKIYEGRAGGIFYKGVHIHRHNRGLVGIALIGNYPNSQPPQAQYVALLRLCVRLCHDLNIVPTAQWQQLLLDNTRRTLSKNNRTVLAVDGHINYPENDHTDPGALDLDRLRADIAAGLGSSLAITFPQTGFTLAEPFRSYWEANGGLAIFGYPISPVRTERNPDTFIGYSVQYFERNRFELHPENVGTPYYILLGRLGVAAADRSKLRNPAPFARRGGLAPGEQAWYFAETGHTLRGGFLDYWQNRGGIAIFGFPLSEEFQEVGEGGIVYTVQYFERNRFEYHPEAPPEYRVLLGRLGVAAYAGNQ